MNRWFGQVQLATAPRKLPNSSSDLKSTAGRLISRQNVAGRKNCLFSACCSLHHVYPYLWKDRANDRPASRSCIEVDKHNLLIFAGQQFALGKRNRNARPNERCANMTVSVVVVPGRFMFIADVVGDQSLEEVRQIVLHKTRLELERRQGGRAANNE